MTEMLLSVFLLGFLGGVHCLGMCGGIIVSLSMAASKTSSHGLPRFLLQLAYNLGRISSYVMAGLIAGAFGFAILSQFGQSSVLVLRGLAAIMLILAGLYLMGLNSLSLVERGGAVLWQKLQPLSKRLLPVDKIPKAYVAGLVWGWLPCGLVYSALSVAMTQSTPSDGAMIMLIFGLGTLPSMMLAGIAAQWLKNITRNSAVRKTAGVMVILSGIWTIAVPVYHSTLHGEHHGHHHH